MTSKIIMTTKKEILRSIKEELTLAIRWDRPSLLVVSNNNPFQFLLLLRDLGNIIHELGQTAVHIHATPREFDIPLMIRADPEKLENIYVITGLDDGSESGLGHSYKALNIRRELLIEDHVRAIFCVTKEEYTKLPILALDFWVFRHRSFELPTNKGLINRHKLWSENINELFKHLSTANPSHPNRAWLDKVVREAEVNTFDYYFFTILLQYNDQLDQKEWEGLISEGDGLLKIDHHASPYIKILQIWIALKMRDHGITFSKLDSGQLPEKLGDNTIEVLARSYNGNGRINAAIELLEKELPMHKRSTNLFQYLITLYLESGQTNLAHDTALRALKSGIRTKRVYDLLFTEAVKRGTLEDTKKYLRKLISLDPENFDLWMGYYRLDKRRTKGEV